MSQYQTDKACEIVDEMIRRGIQNLTISQSVYQTMVSLIAPHITESTDVKSDKISTELHSLKISIKESRLTEYFPTREMSFHDKVILAIGKMADKINSIKKDSEHLWTSKMQGIEDWQTEYNDPTNTRRTRCTKKC